MLIEKLLQKRKKTVAELALQGHQQQKLLQAQSWLLAQRAQSFIGSAPGLVLSFSAGCLFQMRHNSAIKTVRRMVGFRWLRLLL
jgi:hypothetical protein